LYLSLRSIVARIVSLSVTAHLPPILIVLLILLVHRVLILLFLLPILILVIEFFVSIILPIFSASIRNLTVVASLLLGSSEAQLTSLPLLSAASSAHFSIVGLFVKGDFSLLSLVLVLSLLLLVFLLS